MKINVTEVSENYAYSLPNRRFATVALPIMSAWGDGCIAVRDEEGATTYGDYYENFDSAGDMQAFTYGDLQTKRVMPGKCPPTHDIPWQRFEANQEGVARFIATFRGACDKFSSLKDYSYGYALTLLLNGYDILTTRICDGRPTKNSRYVFAPLVEDNPAELKLILPDEGVEGRRPPNTTAIYPGTFGNRLWVRIRPFRGRFNQKSDAGTDVRQCWRTATVFIMDDQGVRKAVESFSYSLTVEDASNITPYWREAYSGSQTKSNFISFDSTNPDLPREPLYDENGLPVVTLLDNPVTVTKATDGSFYIQDGSTQITVVDASGIPQDFSETLGLLTLTENIIYISDFMVFNGSGNGTGIPGTGSNVPNYRWERRDFGFWISECRTTTDSDVTERSGVQGTDYFLHEGFVSSDLIISNYIAPRFRDPGNASDTNNGSGLWRDYYEGNSDIGVQPMSNSQLRLEAVRQAALFYCMKAIPALTDKIYYEFEVLMLPGWDDQDFGAEVATHAEGGIAANNDYQPSQLHRIMAAVCVWGKCGVASLDAPRFAPFKCIKNYEDGGIAQQLSQYIPNSSVRFDNLDIGLDLSNEVVSLDGEPLRSTKAHMVANWVQYNFPMLGNIRTAISPSLANLLIRRAQLKQQAIQQFWCQPTNQVHSLRFGKVDKKVGQVLLEYWQDNDRGVGVNPIVNDPQMGVLLRGNFTLFDNPEMVYNALRNLSTRYLFNEVSKHAFDAGRRIQLTYNNVTAMGRFKAAMYPILDTMMDAGAIDGYLMLINPDINGLDHVNANSVVGNIYLIVNGVVQDIDIALVALPPGTDLSQFAS
jgi:hypothetical protein